MFNLCVCLYLKYIAFSMLLYIQQVTLIPTCPLGKANPLGKCVTPRSLGKANPLGN